MVFIGLVGEHVCERAPWWTDVLVNCLDLWTDVQRPSPLWSAPFSRKVIIGCIRKLAQHEPESDPASSVYSGFPQIPAWIPVRFPSMMVATWKDNTNNSITLSFNFFVCLFVCLARVFYHSSIMTLEQPPCPDVLQKGFFSSVWYFLLLTCTYLIYVSSLKPILI